MNRREFCRTVGTAIPVALISQHALADDKPPAIESKLVGEFVGKSHFDLKAVQAMHKREPSLVNACWDWGNGDFETALGAASHTGARDVASFLLDQGARLDLFAATMLGISAIVRAALDAMPQIHATPGPHGIPLLNHAIAGGKESFELIEYLIARGAAVNAKANNGATALMAAAMRGQAATVKLLLARGADRDLIDIKGLKAIDHAEQQGQTEVADILKSR